MTKKKKNFRRNGDVDLGKDAKKYHGETEKQIKTSENLVMAGKLMGTRKGEGCQDQNI